MALILPRGFSEARRGSAGAATNQIRIGYQPRDRFAGRDRKVATDLECIVCPRSPTSTPHFIVATARSPTTTRSRNASTQEGIRRYGFQGLSYEYIAERLRNVAPAIATGRVIVAHLGSGASMCALAGGRSVESTMGFTLNGLPMGTRPGQLDPGVMLYLIGEGGMTAAAVQDLCFIEIAASRASPASATMCASSRPAPIRAPP
jgi:hypothetical protein